MKEVEAKFLVDSNVQLQSLIGALQVCGLEIGQASKLQIVDRYFDTPDWKLLRQGWTYRWRDGSGKQQISLKSSGTSRGSIRHREEVEQEVASFPTNGQRVTGGPVANLLAGIRQQHLRELFRLDNLRERLLVRSPEGASIELALDHVTLSAGESIDQQSAEKFEFAELELELIEGTEDDLQQFAQVMQQKFQLLPSRLSKFERSVRFLELRLPMPLSKEVQRLHKSAFLRKLFKRPLKKKDPSVQLAYRCLLKQFEAMLAEEPIAWEGLEIEGVHQMRVATRRIRAALWAFKSVIKTDFRQEFNQEFKWLARVLGDVRDMDVYQENLRGYVSEIPPADANCLDDYRQYLVEQRKAARSALADCLSGVRYQTLKSNFADFLVHGPGAGVPPTLEAESIRDAAVRLLGKQYKRVLRLGRSITRDSPDTEVHALRIECKRLRYLFEFFRAVYGKSLNPFIKPLKTLQNVLGELQDAHVATNQLLQHAQRIPMVPASRGQLLALGQLIASQRRHAANRRARFCKIWKRFDRRHARQQMLKVLH